KTPWQYTSARRMAQLLGQAEFQPQDFCDLGELVDRRVRPAVFEVGQPAQGDPGEFSKVTLTKAEGLPPVTHFFPDFLVRHCLLLSLRRITVRFSTLPR